MFFPSSTLGVTALRPKHLIQRMLSGIDALPGEDTTTSSASATMSQEEETNSGIGGGAINEKQRNFIVEDDNNEPQAQKPTSMSSYAPSHHSSHLYHALEGLDRYPNYLARWQEDDIDQLEVSLEEKLALVRKQREEVLQQRKTGAEHLVNVLLTEHEEKERWKALLQPCDTWEQVQERLLDKRAIEAIFKSKLFSKKHNHIRSPTVEQVQKNQVQVELDPERLEAWLEEELYDVYSFPILSHEFCEELREFSRALAQLNDHQSDDFQKQHQLGKRPLNLDLVGLGWVNDLLFHLVMRPLARELFFQSEQLENDLDWRHGYIAGYSAKPGAGKPRERLVTHTDDSEVTMNVCLGDDFEGGLLDFRGLRGTQEEGQLLGTFQPQLGLGLIHAGRHFHDVTQVTSGDRFAFIIWARSWSGIRSTKCPCCWLNRRQGTDCVCGPRWN